ncbi:MAG: hypothetical protein IJR89_00490 [Clostridia bacterium]|nr:hypothetical protein [Clostridia bacterium]
MKLSRRLPALRRTVRAGPEERPIRYFLPSLLSGFVYGIFNAFLAHRARSSWFALMSAYHFLLVFARLYTVLTLLAKEGEKERGRILRSTGVFLLLTDAILGAAVSLLAAGAGGRAYRGIGIYGVAAYTLFQMILSLVRLLSARQAKKPVRLAIRKTETAEALVSVIQLQASLFIAFSDPASAFCRTWNAATGAIVFLNIAVLAVHSAVTGTAAGR